MFTATPSFHQEHDPSAPTFRFCIHGAGTKKLKILVHHYSPKDSCRLPLWNPVESPIARSNPWGDSRC